MSAVAVAVAVVGAAVSHESSRQASRAQGEADKKAIAEQRRQQEESEANLDPFRKQGLAALEQQGVLAGLQGGEAQQQAFQAFADSPGQQFLRDQQERALLRNASAIGGLGGGNIRTALQQQAFGRAQTDIGQQFNRLASISGSGQTAATNIGQFGAQSVANIGNLQQAGGAARASGILGQNQAIQQGLSTGVGIFAQQGGFNQQQPTQQPTLEQQLRADQGVPAGTVI